MRKHYHAILKNRFHNFLVHTREDLQLTQSQMANILSMDYRSYAELDHGKSCCSALTLVLYLIYCCPAPQIFLQELKDAFENTTDAA